VENSIHHVVDLVKGTVTHKFEISGQCSGIVFTNGTISVSVAGDGIQVLDMKGQKLKGKINVTLIVTVLRIQNQPTVIFVCQDYLSIFKYDSTIYIEPILPPLC
jgi:hypothetical protein